MRQYVVYHRHKYGRSFYFFQSSNAPAQFEVEHVALLIEQFDIDFESETEEIDIEEITDSATIDFS